MLEVEPSDLDIASFLTVVENILSDDYNPAESVYSMDVTDAVAESIAEVNRFAHRTFTIEEGGTRTYSAPNERVLWIDEIPIGSSETVVVKLNGTTLIRDTHYQLLLNKSKTAYDRIKRLSDGLAIAWNSSLPGQPEDVVEIEADFGYDDQIPPQVRRAYIIRSVLMAHDRNLLYTGSGGTDFNGISLNDPLLVQKWKDLVVPYIREWPDQVVVIS